MKKLEIMEKKPVFFAVLLILFYIALVGVGDGLSESMQVDHLATSLILLVLSVVLYKLAVRRKVFNKFSTTNGEARKMLFYAPLIALACLQFIGGINPALTLREIGIFILLMIGTGFVEEVLFRGFLFKAILLKSGMKRAVFVSGVTFGLGHIVNLLNGYGGMAQIGQIVVAIAIGIVLALIVAITSSLIPGILFHIVFNISGSISSQDSASQTMMLIAILAIALPYAVYLYKSTYALPQFEH